MAKNDWQWNPEFDLEKTVQIMLKRVTSKLKSLYKLEEVTTATQQIAAIM